MYSCIIVDDEKFFSHRISDYIQANPDLNFDVIGIFSGGEEAIEFINTNPVNLIITDIRMKEMSGLELLHRFVNNDLIEIIIISGYSEFEYARRAITDNALEYLVKPIDFTLLYNALKKAYLKIASKEKLDKNSIGVEQYFSVDDSAKTSITDTKVILVNKAKKYIDENYYMDISLQSISAFVYLSPAYFSRIFTEISHETFSNYLNSVRINKSIELLKQQMKIEDISKAVGFSTSKYFVQKFKAYTGQTPIEYYRNFL